MQVKSRVLLICLLSTVALYAKLPEVYFSATTDLSKKCIEYIRQEDSSIRIVSHRLSDPKVITALLQARRKGVSIEVIVDPKTLTKRSRLRLLAEEGGGVFVWSGKDRMHHAFCLFGQDTLWTGSYTFSVSNRYQHREGAILIFDENAGKNFFEEFEIIKKDYTIPFLDYIKKVQ
jgi:phosphatidylserine/phosphatidylglycerophosphate/cardiolipin synthase-like enzyme